MSEEKIEKAADVEKAAETVVVATEALSAELSSAQKVAAFMEKARLGEYLDMMNKPLRMMWLNFIGGLARGVGLVIGGSIVGVLLLVILVQAMKIAFRNVGGLPMVGEYLEEVIGWVLQVVDQKKADGP